MTSDRIEEIIKQTAYPDSMSVLSALNQVWQETYLDTKNELQKLKTCEGCKYDGDQVNYYDQYYYQCGKCIRFGAKDYYDPKEVL